MIMKEKKPCIVVTFHTTAEAMATERTCTKNGIEGKLISAPRVLSADCGIAWKSPPGARSLIEEALKAEKIEYAGIYELEI
ncbi:MAG: DUF3343 domain-containing protein [Lachnospiraceae bacterium]|nr:DUF3343 domain-containing protein [Lachnospiraceae bacterium]